MSSAGYQLFLGGLVLLREIGTEIVDRSLLNYYIFPIEIDR